VVYFLVFGTGAYYMLKLMAKGPDVGDQAADVRVDVGRDSIRFGHRPISRATDPIDE
jgi:cytochrome d ubiquinol oxidase subunit I